MADVDCIICVHCRVHGNVYEGVFPFAAFDPDDPFRISVLNIALPYSHASRTPGSSVSPKVKVLSFATTDKSLETSALLSVARVLYLDVPF